MDITHKLFEMAEGTELDKKLDNYIDKLMGQGMSELQIMEKIQMMFSGSNPDEEHEIDPSKIDIDQEVIEEFDKFMQSMKPEDVAGQMSIFGNNGQ